METKTNDETYITMAQAARLVPSRTGRGAHISTLWRWSERGVGGVVLETWKCSGQRFTTREALDRFILARSGESTPPSAPSKTTERRIAQAERDAAALGVA